MSWFENKKVLVPIDFGDESRWAVDTALEIADGPANLHVIHVGTDITELAPLATWDLYNEEALSDHFKAQFQQLFPPEDYGKLAFSIRYGDPGNQIASFAKEIEAGLIVMPSHGRTGLRHLLIGSVAERVARLAHCPVLILRR